MKLILQQLPTGHQTKMRLLSPFTVCWKENCYRRNSFETYEQAFDTVDRYIRFYNERRLHGSLHDLSPAEYLRQLSSRRP
jgi:putative transposase